MSPNLAAALVCGLCLALLPWTPNSRAQTASLSVWDGVFTDAQAKRGETAYQENCAACHGENLKATDAEAVDLTGPAWRNKWTGRLLGERFDTIKGLMPKGNPSSLSDKQYLDILAFILRFNDFPAGSKELAPDTVSRITISPKPS